MTRDDVILCEHLPTRVARDLVAFVDDACRTRGRVSICLCGGSTPLPIYEALVEARTIPWGRVWIAFGDERHVPPEHPLRNERAIRDAWLDRVPIPESQIVEWPFVEESDPEDIAAAYERRLVGAFGSVDDGPMFDLVLLGLGEDGHTAGLFPGTRAALAPGLAVGSRPPSQPTARVSLTPQALSSTREAWFLISGRSKSDALRASFASSDADAYPASAIRPVNAVRVYVDVDPFGATSTRLAND